MFAALPAKAASWSTRLENQRLEELGSIEITSVSKRGDIECSAISGVKWMH